MKKYRHFKGSRYEIICQGILESDPDNVDSIMVVYRCLKTGKIWIRPCHEFFGHKNGKRRFTPEK